MTLRLHDTLKALHSEVVAGRLADGRRHLPSRVSLHPASLEDLLLDDDHHHSLTYAWWRDRRLLGIDLVEDWGLPEDVLIVTWPDGRVTALRYLETTPIRWMVRDAMRRAHPWLRLPPPVPPAEPWARWVFDYLPALDRYHRYEAAYGFFVRRPESFVTTTWPVT